MLTNITKIYAEIIFTKQRNTATATLLAKGMFRRSREITPVLKKIKLLDGCL